MKLQWRPLFFFLISLFILLFFTFPTYAAHHNAFSDRGQKEGWLSFIFSKNSSSHVLAANRTKRIDPLNDFKIYTGGWNISNKHYWASVGFSAAPIFVIGIAWFIIFGIVLFCMICCFCCCRSRNYSYSKTAYACSLILIILFSMFAIFGCAVLYDGKEKFHESTIKTANYVLGQENDTVSNLRNFTDYLSAAKLIGVGQFSLSPNMKDKIGEVICKVNVAADELDSHTSQNSNRIQNWLDTMGMILIVAAAILLLLTFLGILLSSCRMEFLVFILVIVGWLLITRIFILSGVFLLLHNIVSDTCVSMDEWVLHPHEHTALDDILPCVDSIMTNEASQQSKNVTHEIISIINQVMKDVSNQNLGPETPPPSNYNQSGPFIPLLCNPNSPDLTDKPCTTEDLHFDNASQVWKGYSSNATTISGNEICTNIGRLIPTIYSNITSALNVSYGIYYYGPYLTALANCTFVRQTFKSVSDNNCPNLERHTVYVYSGLIAVSICVMLSLVFWVIFVREKKERKYGKKILRLDQPIYNNY